RKPDLRSLRIGNVRYGEYMIGTSLKYKVPWRATPSFSSKYRSTWFDLMYQEGSGQGQPEYVTRFKRMWSRLKISARSARPAPPVAPSQKSGSVISPVSASTL